MRIVIEINTDLENYKDVKNLIDIVEIALEQVNEINKPKEIGTPDGRRATISLRVEQNDKVLDVVAGNEKV